MAELNGETAGIITAGVGGLVALGGAVKWLFTARDTRQRMVDAAVDKAFGDLKAKVVRLEGQVALLTNGCTMLMGEVARHVPDSPVLQQANRLFTLAFALPTNLPDAQVDLLDEIHERTKG